MTVFTDQVVIPLMKSNEIEKYLNDFKKENGENKLHFYEAKK